MLNKDWSLVIFTTLSQWSIGITVCFTLLVYLDRDMGLLTGTGYDLQNPVFLALIFVTTATTLSMLHLGNPSNAPNALNNLSGSWLSREILALGLYASSLVVLFVSGWITDNFDYLKYFLVTGSVFGIAFLWMMVRIYLVSTIPPWNSWYTPLSFISTTLCLGLLTFLFLHDMGFALIEKQIREIFAGFLLLILFVELVSGYFQQLRLKKMDTGINELKFDRGRYFGVFLSRIGILMITLVTLLFIATEPGLLAENGQHLWILPVLVLVIAQEFLGRLMFYSSYFRTGV